MAITRATASSLIQGQPKSKNVLAGNAAILPGSYESIATYTGTGSSGVITFSSIPSTYKHLQIRMIFRSTYTGQSTSYMYIKPNNDTSASYSMHGLINNGSAVSNLGSGSRTDMFGYDYPAGSGSTFGVMVMDILDYANTNKYKTFRYLQGYDNNGSGMVELLSASWQKTDAITSIAISDNYANWATGSHFALYGIRG